VKIFQGTGEQWFRVFVEEADHDSFHPEFLSVSVSLDVPAGVEYDLQVYCETCLDETAASSLHTGDGPLVVWWDELTDAVGFPAPTDSSRYVFIRIVYRNGDSCDPWRLTVRGHETTGPIVFECDRK
jgi:hypothetical protein